MADLERRIEGMTFKWRDETPGIKLTIDCPDNTYLDFFGMSEGEARELLAFLEVIFSEEDE